MEHLITAIVTTIGCFLTSIHGGRFDPSKVKPLPPPPAVFMNTSQLITHYGYTPELYYVQTEDGYILSLVHIAKAPGPPVLLMSGLFGGGETFVVHGPGHDLGFILADMGYDVWLGSQRGNADGSHVRFTKSHAAYWDFSHDEMGYYDVPAMVDKILSKSRYTKLFFGGISLASAFYMALCSERPEYEAVFAGSFQLAPWLYGPSLQEYTPDRQIYMSSFYKTFQSHLNMFGPSSLYNRKLNTQISFRRLFEDPVTRPLCISILESLTGFKYFNMAPGWFGYTVPELLSGGSVRSAVHLLQLVNSGGGLQKFDFGRKENFRRYGTYTPPSYNLSKISSPTAIYYSKADIVSLYSGQNKSRGLIGHNVKRFVGLADKTYGHMEAVFGKDLYKLAYPDIVDFLDNISGL